MGIIEELVDEPPEDQLHEGATVRVDGLKAAPEHNGVEGELLKFDQDAGRWQVLLATGPAVKVKSANLIFVRPKPAFRFAPRHRSGSDDEISVEAMQIHKPQCHSICYSAISQDADFSEILHAGHGTAQCHRQLRARGGVAGCFCAGDWRAGAHVAQAARLRGGRQNSRRGSSE
jgi:hypothetical protein